MTEQERVMEWSNLSSVMLQSKAGALTETTLIGIPLVNIYLPPAK